MKAYWDSSAIIQAASDTDLRVRLHAERGFTRSHSLAEAFSAFTGGNLLIRLDADQASAVVSKLAADLDFIELTSEEILNALRVARIKGVRGGRVHDYLHVLAAEKSGVPELLTADRNDLKSLSNRLRIEQV